MSKNFNKICRLCMSITECMLPLFEDSSILPEKIMVLIPTLKIHLGDNLPSQVCQQCVEQVNSFFIFKLQCENSDTMLNGYLNQRQEENVNIQKVENWMPTNDDVKNSDPSLFLEKMDKKDVSQDVCKMEEEHYDRLLSEIKEEPCDEESKDEITSDPEVRQSNIDGNVVRTNTNTYSLSGAHKTKHTVKTIPCHICHKILIYRRRHEHIRRHLDDRTFECSNCGKKFSEKSDLKKHFLIHSNVKAHKCDICGKSFIRKGHLKRHMTVHTGEKQFSCDICGMSYTQRHNLTKHRRNHEQF